MQQVHVRSTGVNASAVSHDGQSLQLLRRGEEATVEVGATIFLLPGLYPLQLQSIGPTSMSEQSIAVTAATAAATDARGSTSGGDHPLQKLSAVSLPKSGPAPSAAAEWNAAQVAWEALEQEAEDELSHTTAAGADRGGSDDVDDGDDSNDDTSAIRKPPPENGAVINSASTENSDVHQSKRGQQRQRHKQATDQARGSKRAREELLSAESSVSDSDSDFHAEHLSDDGDYQNADSPASTKRKRRNTRSNVHRSSGSDTWSHNSATRAAAATSSATAAAAGVDADQASSKVSSSTSTAVWEWNAGRSGWKTYSAMHNDLIEAAYQAWWEQSLDHDEHEHSNVDRGADEDGMIRLDNGYTVVFAGSDGASRGGATGMRQIKVDDPTRSRRVRRRMV